jgi:hypothetical protein
MKKEWFVVQILPKWFAIGSDGSSVSGVRVVVLETDRYLTLIEAVAAAIRKREEV